MEDKKEIIVDWKDYTPPVLNDDPEFAEVILEDIKGTKFKAKFRKPSISELLRVERENTYIRNIEEKDGKKASVSGLEKEKVVEVILKNFDFLPKISDVNIFTRKSIQTIVDTFFMGF